MSWFHPSTMDVDARNHASAAEIVTCFRDQELLLNRLAFLITADRATAEQAVAQACEITLQGNSPFRDWLLEWAKAATIAAAISLQGETIRAYEGMYKDRRCPHVEHLCQFDDERRAAGLALILQMNDQKIIAELNPLCRAILVLRIAIRSSIQDCSLRLNVSRAAVLAANCLAMTWLDYRHIKALDDEHKLSHALKKYCNQENLMMIEFDDNEARLLYAVVLEKVQEHFSCANTSEVADRLCKLAARFARPSRHVEGVNDSYRELRREGPSEQRRMA